MAKQSPKFTAKDKATAKKQDAIAAKERKKYEADADRKRKERVTRPVVCIPIDDLTMYPLNARTHSLEQLKTLVKRMLTVGWTNPILAVGRKVVAGHGRIAAAKMIYAEGGTITFPDGSEIPSGTVPVLDCTGWSEETIRAEILADNQTALSAGWDFALLRDELAAIDDGQFDMSLIGFTEAEREQIATWTGEKKKKEPPKPEEKPGEIQKVECPCCGESFDLRLVLKKDGEPEKPTHSIPAKKQQPKKKGGASA